MVLSREVLMSRYVSDEELAVVGAQCTIMKTIIGLFRGGVLLLDEVDLVLHPLKSELNWPLGLPR